MTGRADKSVILILEQHGKPFDCKKGAFGGDVNLKANSPGLQGRVEYFVVGWKKIKDSCSLSEGL
jgi:hypothetical protein